MTLLAQLFNVTNHANFNIPVTNPGSTIFGQVNQLLPNINVDVRISARERNGVRHDETDQSLGAAGPRRGAGELEAAALAALQAAGTALTPGQVRERLGGRLAYTTVVTILSRLHAKGVLSRVRTGRAYAYAPVADEPGLAVRVLRGSDRE